MCVGKVVLGAQVRSALVLTDGVGHRAATGRRSRASMGPIPRGSNPFGSKEGPMCARHSEHGGLADFVRPYQNRCPVPRTIEPLRVTVPSDNSALLRASVSSSSPGYGSGHVDPLISNCQRHTAATLNTGLSQWVSLLPVGSYCRMLLTPGRTDRTPGLIPSRCLPYHGANISAASMARMKATPG